ncbi:hypothetical protein ACFL5V_11275 [Fibrobacterota bacterium]
MPLGFIIKIALFLTIGVLPSVAFFMLTLNGYADYYYLKFTTSNQKSLILGTSRALQGILPSVLNELSEKKFEGPVYNYAFTLGTGSMGPSYYYSIMKKLDKSVKNGLFIIEINPMSISTSLQNTGDHDSLFRERMAFVAKMERVNQNPNIEYLWNYFNYPLFNMLLKNIKKKARLCDDGWLEINTNITKNKKRLSLVSQQTIKEYEKKFKSNKLSQTRISWLGKLMRDLSQYGRVVLIRLPVDREMADKEDQYFPDFDKQIQKVAVKNNVIYFKIETGPEFQTIDGNHLSQESAKKVTIIIRNIIKRELAELSRYGI